MWKNFKKLFRNDIEKGAYSSAIGDIMALAAVSTARTIKAIVKYGLVIVFVLLVLSVIDITLSNLGGSPIYNPLNIIVRLNEIFRR